PWTGSKHEVYGWASWNGVKSTLALRNGDNNAQTFTTTLREALDIPAHVKGSIRLKSSFKVQDALEGMPELDTPIDIDRELTLVLPASSVYCFDGIDADHEWPVYPDPVLPGEEDPNPDSSIGEVNADNANSTLYDLQGRRVNTPALPGLYIRDGRVIKL
ncbi:MAG: hypothetical protein K2F96_03430, partial [Muribaculaceae bacterium]|nr:hypothetical protein [Muribaculaceae bacterium]